MRHIEINEDNPSQLILCYGTLKKNNYNWHYFLEGKSIHLGEFITEPAFTMYTTGTFPVITTGSTSIVCDLFKVRSNKVLQDIFNLEGCGGQLNNPDDFYKLKEINTPEGKAIIFWQPEYEGSPEAIIKNEDNIADWNRRPLLRKQHLQTS